MNESFAPAWLIQGVDDLDSAICPLNGERWANACLLAHSAALKFNRAFLLLVNINPLPTRNIERLNTQIQGEGYHIFSASDKYGALALTRSYLVVGEQDVEMETPPCELYGKPDARQHIQWAIAALDAMIVEAAEFVDKHVPGVRERIKAFD